MDYILTEAEEEGVPSREEDEEETEDTGIGTYSQLFAEDSEIDTYNSQVDETDFAHSALLNQQQLEDDNRVLSELGYRLCAKRRRTTSGGGDGGTANGGEERGTDPQGLCDSPVQHTHTLCDILQRGVPTAASTIPTATPPRTHRGHRNGRQSGLPCKPRVEGRIPSENANAVQQAKDPATARPPARPVLHPITNTRAAQGQQLVHTKQYENRTGPASAAPSGQKPTEGQQLLQRLLDAKNGRQAALAIFKETYGPSYTDVTRPFKSDKTQSCEWVFVILGSASITYEALRECLRTHTEFMLCDINPSKQLGLFYCGFHASKNRDGVRRCLRNYNVEDRNLTLCEPPNKRSITAALYFQRLMVCHGEMPSWCTDLIAAGELANGEGFQLSKMVQWAMDNNLVDEGEIAYGYAQLADVDANAQLWLKSNAQAKYVRDATIMVKHFNRGRLQATPMVEHIACRMREYIDQDDEEGWKQIVVFMRYQHVVLNDFLQALRYWLKGRPKKSTIAVLGVPDSGKTMFTMSLIRFMQGKVLNYANSKSHFWLQPLVDCKAAAIDDVTFPCWDYINVYLRPALDGSTICIDCKHRAPIQAKCPPLLLTSNYDPREVTGPGEGQYVYKYLFNRITFICFNRVIPQVEGRPRFLLQPAHWRSFFLKYKDELELDLTGLDYGQPTGDAGTDAGQGE
ncbi:E1 [Puffin papillomavirus 1]|uniref:DNA 3'-5' helicase n=1 Tax=Puffin papillomavirus 1 TaxID=2562557 RepID=A0AAE6D334_9PAPI|nr:E1 [Puffin papillomavirus 1]